MNKISTLENQDYKLIHLLGSAVILSVILCLYFWGITTLDRRGVMLEAALVILFPLGCILLGLIKLETDASKRVFSLFVIESFFNILVVLSKFAIDMNWAGFNNVLSYGFVLFFVVQTLGFVLYSLKFKNYLGVFNSILFFIMIFLWYLDSPKTNMIGPDGRFLFWGENAPWLIMCYYLVWLLNVVFIDTLRLPNLRQAVVAFTSAVFAIFTGEFFHIRIMIASHMFLLDLVFGYGDKETTNDFCVMTPKTHAFFDQKIKPYLKWIVSLTLIVIFVAFLVSNYV